MGRRSASSKPAVYVALRPCLGGVRNVLGTFVSCPGDVHRDAPRLFDAPVEWVSWSAANRFTRKKAREADKSRENK